jgi:hypothetical protein
MDLLISVPIRLSRHKDILTMLHNGMLHPLARSLILVAVQLSADTLKARDFHHKLCQSSYNPGELELGNSTRWLGINGAFGVYKNVKSSV